MFNTTLLFRQNQLCVDKPRRYNANDLEDKRDRFLMAFPYKKCNLILKSPYKDCRIIQKTPYKKCKAWLKTHYRKCKLKMERGDKSETLSYG